MQIKNVANAYLIIGIVIAALWPVVLNLATSVNVFEFTFFAYLLALPASLAFVVLSGKTKDLRKLIASKRDLAVVCVVGVLNYGFMDFGILFAEHYISPSLAAVLLRSYPLLMLVFLPVILREKVSRIQVGALMLGFVGIIAAVMFGQSGAFGGTEAMMGIGMALAVALATAFSLTLTKRYIYDTESSILAFNCVSVIFFGIAFFAVGAPLGGITAPVIFALLFTSIVANVLFAFVYYMSIRMMKITVVTNSYLVVPFLTFAFSYIILGQPMLPIYFLVGILVSAGILLQRFDKVGGTFLAKEQHKLRDFVIFDVSGAFANTGEVAISSALREGARVMAVKLPERHRKTVEKRINGGNYSSVFTNKHEPIASEVNYVKGIMGAAPSDMILMKVGSFDEGEAFFAGMSDLVSHEEPPFQNNNS
ncbi:MAG: EamA family transporter [Candidatus Marsarchaeota archaeon]|nr:EamA family transporter [Candidatus Marsarchaeota archaeon]